MEFRQHDWQGNLITYKANSSRLVDVINVFRQFLIAVGYEQKEIDALAPVPYQSPQPDTSEEPPSAKYYETLQLDIPKFTQDDDKALWDTFKYGGTCVEDVDLGGS